MKAAVDLSEQQLEQLRELTKESDIAAALRTAVIEYIRHTKQLRLQQLAGKIELLDESAGPKEGTNGVHPTDAWMDEVEAIAAQGNPEDDQRLNAAIQAIRQQQKDLARKKLGLEP
jgi:hypothetical protein